MRYRANLALGLAERNKDPRQPFVVDEWTSELDRELARVVSVAFCKRMSREWALQPAEEVVEALPEVEEAWEACEAREEEIQEEDPVVEDQAEAGTTATSIIYILHTSISGLGLVSFFCCVCVVCV